jgi:hypothetical protein
MGKRNNSIVFGALGKVKKSQDKAIWERNNNRKRYIR